MSGKKGFDFVRQVADSISASKGFGQVMKNVQITSGGNGKCIAEFTVAEEQTNINGTLHGGYIATLVDVITNFALMTAMKENKYTGVSVDLRVDFISTAKVGDNIIIDAKALKTGKNLSFMECEVRKKEDNTLIAKGCQTIFSRL